MKRLIISIIILCAVCSSNLLSQDSVSEYGSESTQDTTTKRSFFSLGYNVIFTGTKPVNSIYLQFEYMVNKNLGINYSIGANMGSKLNGFHTSLGSVGAYYLLDALAKDKNDNCNDCDDENDCNDDYGYAALALMLLVPEGITIYTKPESNICPAIYINLLNAEIYEKDTEELRLCPAFGFKMQFKGTNGAAIEPMVGIKVGMPNSEVAFQFGLSLRF